MSERKLNINAPLMSVRRSSATSPSLTEARKKILEKHHTLPCHRSDFTLDQVTEPVAVPFNWEHIPGRRKGNNGGSEPQLPKNPSITPSPKLPPGKYINSTKQPLEKESKVASKFISSNKSKSFSSSVAKIDGDRERKAEINVDRRRSNVVVEEEEEKDVDVYSDALETLSPNESFSMNCSVSGVSGLDTFDAKAKKFGNFPTDQQTRDFMMNRFLPAAKAMTLQPHQYSSKKQSVLVEQQPRDVSKLIREAKKPLPNQYSTDIVPYSGHYQEELKESEDEGDDDDDYGNSASFSGKGCGLLPNLHIRNSLCLLNPVAGMQMKNQVPLSSTNEVVKPNKRSHIRSFSPVPAVKKAWDAIHKNKSSSRSASPDMVEVRKKWSSESNRFYSGELQPGRLSPFRRSRAAAAGLSPCRSKPQSPFRGGDSKEAENNKSGMLKFHTAGLGNNQGMLYQGGAKRISYSGSLAIEKTLYIDNTSTVKLSSSNLSSVDNKRRIDTMISDLDKRRGKGSSSTIESSPGRKHIQALEEKNTLDSKVLSSMDDIFSTLPSMSQSHLIVKEDKAEGLTTGQDIINQELASLQLVQGTLAEDSKSNNQKIVLANDSGKGGAESPLPPPLPKSPSESWLWRALPIVSVKNSFLHSNKSTESRAKRHDSNSTSSTIKWETIVKTSNLHHDHKRYSQELTTRTSQHSKS